MFCHEREWERVDHGGQQCIFTTDILTSRKGITNIKKGITNIKGKVTGDATGISGKHWQQTLANNGVLRQTLGRSYKHCGAAGELWGNFGSNWVLDTGYWQETIKNIDKRGNFVSYKYFFERFCSLCRSLHL